MLTLLDSNSSTRLSDEGIQVLNCYAEKGSQLIRSEIMPPPKLDTFLELYYKLLDNLFY